MKITPICAKCLYDQQLRRSDDPDYLAEVRALLNARAEDDPAPLLVHRFDQAYARRFGASDGFRALKRRDNDLVLGMETRLQARIDAAPDPIATALAFARTGNYIDYAAMPSVDADAFMRLFDGAVLREEETPVYRRFLDACEAGRSFLLIADNCGEIVLDRMLLERLKARFPHLELSVLVRGGEALNDATREDAVYAGMDRVARIVDNGMSLAGTVPRLLPEPAREALYGADVVLSKGQGNYECLSGHGLRVFYAFLCKCGLFTERFGVEQFTGMLVEEREKTN